MKYENIRDVLIDSPKEHDDLKARSDLLFQIEGCLEALAGDKAEKLGINQAQLDNLMLGKLDRFGLTELESIARRAGIRCF